MRRPDFFPADLFATLYSSSIRQALETALITDALSAAIPEWPIGVTRCISQINAKVCEWVDSTDGSEDWAMRRHVRNLRGLRGRAGWRELRSDACCLSCLFEKPQHALRCGHAICDACAQRRGRRRYKQEYAYLLTSCPFCGASIGQQQITLKPPTAGVRILSLDAGGVRGVGPLKFLQLLQGRMGRGGRIQDYFDLAVGTSAGTERFR